MTEPLEDFPYMPMRPSETMVVIIDPLPCFVDHLSEGERQVLRHKLEVLCHTALKINVPVVTSVLGNGRPALWPEGLWDNRDILLYHRTTANPWDDRQLMEALNKHGPPYLILAGFWGEVSLSMMAMSSLRGGHEVFLLMDCCPDLERPVLASQLEFMIRATIAPVTWRQVIFEWARHQPLILNEKLLDDVMRDTAVPTELISALQTQ